MKVFRILALAGLFAGTTATASFATDAMTSYTPTDTMMVHDDAFDWEGFYFGPRVALWPDSPGIFYLVGVGGGFNVVHDNMVFGIDAHFGDYLNGDGFSGVVQARAGVLLSDNLLVFAAVGPAFCCADYGADWYGAAGAGAELALGDQMTLTGKVNALFDGSGVFAVESVFGFNWYLH